MYLKHFDQHCLKENPLLLTHWKIKTDQEWGLTAKLSEIIWQFTSWFWISRSTISFHFAFQIIHNYVTDCITTVVRFTERGYISSKSCLTAAFYFWNLHLSQFRRYPWLFGDISEVFWRLCLCWQKSNFLAK